MRPVPSLGTKLGFIFHTGRSVRNSRSRMNGDEPILTPPSTTPTIMLTKNTCTPLNTAITGASHWRLKRMMQKPSITTCQKIQSRNEPSWPSQKHEIMYCTGRWFELWLQA